MPTKNSADRSTLLASMADDFRQLSTATILFHQAIADRLGMHVTDHKCAEILAGKGPITAGELAQLTGLTTGAVTGVIDRLERAGFVRRAKDPNDRRRVVIEPVSKRMEQDMKPLFGSVGQTMAALCDEYSTRELAVIRDFITRFSRSAWDETRKLREGTGLRPEKPAKTGADRTNHSRNKTG
jgi:DNA-binding MarR family transcriptional regulator